MAGCVENLDGCIAQHNLILLGENKGDPGLDSPAQEKGKDCVIASKYKGVFPGMCQDGRHVSQTPISQGVVRVDVGVDDSLDPHGIEVDPGGDIPWWINDEAFGSPFIPDDIAQEAEAVRYELFNGQHVCK